MLHLAIAIGLVLGLGTGLLAAAGVGVFAVIASASAPFGTLFLNAIRMVVVPLVMAVVFTGVARLGEPRKVGRLGGLTLVFFWVSLVPAILVGMGVMWLGLRFAPAIAAPAAAAHEAPQLPGFVDFLVSLVPANPFAAATSGSLLPLIVFSALVAAAAGTLAEPARTRLLELAEAASAALIKLVWWILWTAPIGVFGLTAPVTAKLGWGLVQNLAVFVVCVLLGLALYLAVVYLPLLAVVARIGPVRLFKGTLGAVSIGFSTTSTAAALPVTLEEVKRNLGVREAVADLVLPLGAAMYRPGSALFQGAAVVFLAHLYRVPFPASAVGGAILATFLVSLTVAPVPSSSVVTLAPALDAIGVPLSGLSILLGIDRIPDMFRTSVNLLGQITTSVAVNAWTREPEHVETPASTTGPP